MDRRRAKELEREVRRLLEESGSADDVLDRIEHGMATSDDPGVIGLLLLGRTLARQTSGSPAELAADALAASSLLRQADEIDAAAFADAVGAAMRHRAGDLDGAAELGVRTLAALERMADTEEWGSRTAHALGILFGELHAYELASRSSARSLAWEGAREDANSRLVIEAVRGFFAIHAAETYPPGSAEQEVWIDAIRDSLDGLRQLDRPASRVAASSVETELAMLLDDDIDPDRLAAVESQYESTAAHWVSWHQLVRGRALSAAGRHEEAIEMLLLALDSPWPWSFAEQSIRRHLANALAALGRTEEALEQLHLVLDDVDHFVQAHVARQAKALAERVDAENRSIELRQRSEELARQVARDHLTGLASRRALDELLDQPVDGEEEHAVFVCDLDHFKLVNDGYGHAVGDEVLSRIGRILSEHIRASDTAGRFGGEEFVVVMKADTRTAASTAERLRRAIEWTLWADVAEGLGVTVSIGVAVGVAPLRDLLRAADIAVYDAKDAGRNRVHVAGDLDGSSRLYERSDATDLEPPTVRP
ncbi:MAG: diguanylate cyclase [Actinomycetota bacterium]